jgi:hypothetical protein
MNRTKAVVLALILGSAVLVGGREAHASQQDETYCYLPYPILRTVGQIPQVGWAQRCSDSLGNVTVYEHWL